MCKTLDCQQLALACRQNLTATPTVAQPAGRAMADALHASKRWRSVIACAASTTRARRAISTVGMQRRVPHTCSHSGARTVAVGAAWIPRIIDVLQACTQRKAAFLLACILDCVSLCSHGKRAPPASAFATAVSAKCPFECSAQQARPQRPSEEQGEAGALRSWSAHGSSGVIVARCASR